MRFAVVLVIVMAACLLLPLLANLLGLAVGVSFLALQFAGYTFLCILMLLFFWIMVEAGYKVFLRPYHRLWRLKRSRNARYLKEVINRGKT